MIDAKAVFENVLAEHTIYDEDGEEATVETLLEQLEQFPDERAEQVEGKRYATACIVSSESGDTNLVLNPGVWSEREIALETFEMSPTWWGGFASMSVSDLRTIEV